MLFFFKDEFDQCESIQARIQELENLADEVSENSLDEFAAVANHVDGSPAEEVQKWKITNIFKQLYLRNKSF